MNEQFRNQHETGRHQWVDAVGANVRNYLEDIKSLRPAEAIGLASDLVVGSVIVWGVAKAARERDSAREAGKGVVIAVAAAMLGNIGKR